MDEMIADKLTSPWPGELKQVHMYIKYQYDFFLEFI